MERIDLLIDELGKGDNVFEKFAVEFEFINLQGYVDPNLNNLKGQIEYVERLLQDISEMVKVEDELSENVFSVTSQKTKQLLSIWLPILHNTELEPRLLSYFNEELNKLIEFLKIENIKTLKVEEVKNAFDKNFLVNSVDIENLRNNISHFTFHRLNPSDLVKVSNIYVKSLTTFLTNKHDDKGVFKIFHKKKNDDFTFVIHNLTSELKVLQEKNLKQIEIPDDEEAIYTCDLKIWIDSDDAVEVNNFLSIISSVFGQLENIDLKIKDSGKGSYWQKMKITIRGWFAKEEFKQIIKKSKKAVESYALDRHIESGEISKLDRKEKEENLKRIVPENISGELHKIKLQKEREELKSMKIDNAIKKIELLTKLSEVFASKLVDVDSDYRIEIDDLMLIKKENGKIEFNDVEEIDKKLLKEKRQEDDSNEEQTPAQKKSEE